MMASAPRKSGGLGAWAGALWQMGGGDGNHSASLALAYWFTCIFPVLKT